MTNAINKTVIALLLALSLAYGVHSGLTKLTHKLNAVIVHALDGE